MRNVAACFLMALQSVAPTDAAPQGLECLRIVQHGVSQSQTTSRQALIAAQSDWERAAKRYTGSTYRWVLAMQTGRQVVVDPTTDKWRAHVTAHPCSLRAPKFNEPCRNHATPAAAQREGCDTFYP